MKFGKKLAILLKTEFDSEPAHNKKKKLKKRINTKEGFQCFCVPVILIDSVCRKDKNYYPQMFLGKI